MTSIADRHRLYEHARQTWGEPTARTLMDLLPPDPDQLATKADLALTRADLRSEMAELRTELRTEMAELRVELHQALADQTRTLVLGAVGAIMTSTALSFAAAQLA